MAKGEGLSPEIEKYDALWRKDPKSRVFAQLADAYRKSGLYEEAISVCEEGLKIHPQYASARVVLGRTYLEKGERDKGVKELEEALALSPDNLLSLKTLGELYQEEGKYRDALDKYKKAFLLNPLDRQTQSKVEEIKALMAAPSPPTLPPLEAKTDLPTAAEEQAAEALPAVPFPAEFPSLSALPTEPPAPPIKEDQPLIVLEEPEGLEEELSLSLADLEEVEEIPVTARELKPFLAEELPPLELLEAPDIKVEEVPRDQAELDVLTTTTLGDLYLEQGFWDRAIEIYYKILEIEPKNPQILAKLAEALARKSAAGQESAEPVYVIPEELVPLEGEAAGPRLGELPLETMLAQDLTPPPLPPEPTVLFPPEELAQEVEEEPLFREVTAIPAAPPLLPQEAALSPVLGDTTLMALEQLLTSVKKEQQKRNAAGDGR